MFLRSVHTIYTIEVNTTVKIQTTSRHPFYVEKEGWVVANQLQVGMKLQTINGTAVITNLRKERTEEEIPVYNFRVSEWSSYFVSEWNVYVHNGEGYQGNSGANNIYGLLPSDIPSVKDGKFDKFFNSLTPDELNEIWKDPALSKTIKSRLRHPGKLHEWHMVARTPIFKRWNRTAEDIKDMRSLIKNVEFINPTGKHGGKGSTTAHNEILEIIDSSLDYDTFKRRLNNWASYRLKGGVGDLPEKLRLD